MSAIYRWYNPMDDLLGTLALPWHFLCLVFLQCDELVILLIFYPLVPSCWMFRVPFKMFIKPHHQASFCFVLIYSLWLRKRNFHALRCGNQHPLTILLCQLQIWWLERRLVGDITTCLWGGFCFSHWAGFSRYVLFFMILLFPCLLPL